MIREYRPALAAFLLMMSMALTTTALSFFVTPVCDALGVGRGEFTVYYSLMTASGAASIPFLGQMIQKRGVRLIVAVSAIWVSLGFAAFSVAQSLLGFYAAGAFIGVFGTACVSLCATVIVQQRYSGKNVSTILGAVMAGSGVGGMVISLLLPGLILELGWRWGYRIIAACWLVMGLSALTLLGRDSLSRGVADRKTDMDGVSRAEALRSPKLYLLLAVSFILSAACGIQQQLPSLLSGYGLVTDRVGILISFFTVSLTLGKVGQGLFYGKCGAVRGGITVIGIFAGSYVMLTLPELVWLGLPALAVGMGTVTTLLPLLTRRTFGNREFASIWGIVYSAANVGTLFATPLYGLAYDASGVYDLSLKASVIALLMCIALMSLCFRKK